MFKVISSLNFVETSKLLEETQSITLRGYSEKTFLTGQFALKLSEGMIRPLSVSDISDYLCPTRRDLYFKKGKNRPARLRRTKTWGSTAGHLVEAYIRELFEDETNRRKKLQYASISKAMEKRTKLFRTRNSDALLELGSLKGRPEENPEWLLNLLSQTGKMSIGFKSLNRILAQGNTANTVKESDLSRRTINPNILQIGISSGVKPDFLIESHKVVGDIKSGIVGFKDYFLYTCTGYALAYENAMGKGNDIDIGVILFFPTRCSDFAKPLTFSQVYIFAIDDELRDQFKRRRNEAYNIISQDTLPRMPDEKDSWHCSYCQFAKPCKESGE